MNPEYLREMLDKLRRGRCWCEMGIGNPMVEKHSDGCKMAEIVYAQLTKIIVGGL